MVENWIIYGGMMVLGLLLTYITKSYFLVPKELKELHAASFLTYLISVIKGESFDIRYDVMFREVLERYGCARIWMQGHWGVVISDPTLVNEVQSQTDRFLKFSPAESSNHLLMIKFLGLSSVLLADGKEWQRHRRIINPPFKRAFPTKLFGESGLELIKILELDPTSPIRIRDLLQRFTLDVLGKGLFSYDFGAVRRGNIDKHLNLYNDVIEKVFDPIYFVFTFLEYCLPSRLLLHKKAHQFRSFLSEIIDQRIYEIHHQINRDDLLTLMIKASLQEEERKGKGKGKGGLNREELLNNLATFFIAGHDTTANTLTTVFYYLSKYQDIQKRARDEILNIMGDHPLAIPTFDQQNKMHYINQIIKESMRLVPTVSIKRRFCTELTKLSNGLIIPPNTNISIHVWAQHRNPNIFPNPESFDPDRFQDPHGHQARHWMPFGSGTRTCVGIHFSMLEQRILIAMLLSKFHLDLGPLTTSLPRIHFGSSGLQFPQDIEVIFTPRH